MKNFILLKLNFIYFFKTSLKKHLKKFCTQVCKDFEFIYF